MCEAMMFKASDSGQPEIDVGDLRDGHSLIISRKENGYAVKVGCKKFVFSDLLATLIAVELFYQDPKAAVERYCRDEGEIIGYE